MNKSETICSLAASLAKAQGEFTAIAKNRSVEITMKTGGKFKFKYADLDAIIEATRPALSKNGLAIIQPIIDDKLLTIITHSSGEFIESSMPLPARIGDDPKQYGAHISYLRRYAYQSLICVMADDDLDANGDDLPKQPVNKPKQPQQPTTQQEAPTRRLSSAERELGVKDMKAAPDEAALKEALLGWHKAAKDIGDKESVAFFNDCYHQCAAAFAEY